MFVGRDANPNIIDSSSREGLIHEEAFNELRAFVYGCLRLLEAHRHKLIAEKEIDGEKKSSPTEEVTDLKKELTVLKKDLKAVKSQIPSSSYKPVARTIDKVDEVSEKIKETEKSLGELVSQSRVLRGLATIGIASAVFGHETQASISEFISATYTSSSYLSKKPPKVDIAIEELEKAKKYANQVSAWGAFALGRIQRDKRRRRKINITNLIGNTIKEIIPVFNAANIEIQKDLADVEGRAYAMDIEAILLNLMTNAYSACQQISRKRAISLNLREKKVKDQRGIQIIVADSGPGIDKKFAGRIWDPLFTTKVDKEGKETGTGLGLTIVHSIIEDSKGIKSVDSDPLLKGAKFSIWLPVD